MGKKLKLSFLFILLPLIFSCGHHNFKIGQWDIFELTVKNNNPYNNPFTSVTLLAKYTRPDGTITEFPGFYAGENLQATVNSEMNPGSIL